LIAVQFAMKDHQEALSVLVSVPDDAAANKSAVKSTASGQQMMMLDGLSFSVCYHHSSDV